MKKLHLLVNFLLLGFAWITSCNPKEDNFSSQSGNVDPLTIEKSSQMIYFPFESIAYTTIKSRGIDSSSIVFGTKNLFALGQRGYCFQGDTVKSFAQVKVFDNNVITKLKEFTIATWVKLPALVDSRTAHLFMFNGGDATTGAGTLALSVDNHSLKGLIYSDSVATKPHEIAVDRSAIGDNKWVHIALTYTQSTSCIALYANGALLKEDTCYADAGVKLGRLILTKLSINRLFIGSSSQLALGQPAPGAIAFSGALDEMRIWNKGLSKEVVGELYRAELSQAQNK